MQRYTLTMLSIADCWRTRWMVDVASHSEPWHSSASVKLNVSLFCRPFAACILLFCLRRFKVLNAWPPAVFLLWMLNRSSSRIPCFASAKQALVFLAVVSDCNVGPSVCRCSSRRFSSTFSRLPQAPMTTSGWSFKPSLEYAQVGFLQAKKCLFKIKY